MAGNTAREGARFERRVRDQLIEDGYRVTRAAGSRGLYDLDAEKPGQRLLVQCKRTGRGKAGIPNIPPAEWNALYELACERGALAIGACRRAPRQPVVYWVLTGPKSGVKGKPVPVREFVLDEVEAGGAA
jgi:Holliday junction resolvase